MVWILLPCAVISLLDNKELSPLICPFPWVYFPVDLFYVNALMDAVVALFLMLWWHTFLKRALRGDILPPGMSVIIHYRPFEYRPFLVP